MKEITIDELAKRLESGEDISVIDIRETNEYDDWHIHGAENIPSYNALGMGRTDALSGQLGDRPRSRPIVTVCRMGQVSQLACGVLENMGYDAWNLIGGMFAWTNAWSTAPVPCGGGTIVQIRRNGKGCLSYLIGADGVGAVIDPCLDVSIYKNIASDCGLAIEHVLETHVHADHISRARRLCEDTGATLRMPRNNRVNFEYSPLDDGQEVSVGSLVLKVISTPGHTGESVCFQLGDDILFSGDTVFVEGIGRPDLEKGDSGATDGATMLFSSLHDKILTLPDDILVCPGHTSESIGFDRVALAARLAEIKPRVDLLDEPEAAFVSKVVGSLGAKPPNFQRVIGVNEGRIDLGRRDPLELEAGPNRCAVKQS